MDLGGYMSDDPSARNTAQSGAQAVPHELWTKPRPQKMPAPSYAPAVIALAIVCILWGIVTTYLISLLGLVLLGVGLTDWIGGLRDERE